MDYPLDLSGITHCDQEPIHIPGAILPHGAMLVLDSQTLEVLQGAGNCQGLLGKPVAELLGHSAALLFDAEQLTSLHFLSSKYDLAKPRHLLDPMLRVGSGRPLDASLHRSDGALVLEFEAADKTERFATDPLSAVQEMVRGFDDAPSLLALCQLAAERVREVARYDRVLIYRFMQDESGWVIAESREPHLEPFLNLHYPAADIPAQARALYIRNSLRLITQVNYEPCPLQPELNPQTGRPLDMSQATLRDVSPIHRQYLRNMGVDASMSISIIRGGKLWGLIACHHDTPRQLPRHLRAVCELFGSMFSLQLEARETGEQFKERLASRMILQNLMLNLATADDYALGLTRQSPNLLDYIADGGHSADGIRRGGVAVSVGGRLSTLGLTPAPGQIGEIVDWLNNNLVKDEGIYSTDRLSEVWPAAREHPGIASGLLAIAVSPGLSDYIIWFRPEFIESIEWAGDLSKMAVGAGADSLTPRKSFAAWKETIVGRSTEWTRADLDAAFDLRISLLHVVLRRINLANRARTTAADRDKLLMAELDHRVKNTLANIQALVSQTSRSADSLTGFVTGLDGRIQSMAKAHSLLSESRWEGVSIEKLIDEELRPYGRHDYEIAIRGPSLVLTSKAALALSLAIHELATNAAKYGALSAPGGRVSVRWALPADGGIELNWTEAGGPEVLPPTRFGFGSTLIGRALAMETGGSANLEYAPSGVVCDIVLPQAAIASVGADAGLPSSVRFDRIQPSCAPDPDAAYRILIVEDSFLLIRTLEQTFEDLGWTVIGPATRVADAIFLARTESIDAALLDINLDGEMSWDVAKALRERNIPILLCSGYDLTTMLPAELLGVGFITKPCRKQELEERLSHLIQERRGRVVTA